MYLKIIFDEDPLCENSTCHKNKAVSIFFEHGFIFEVIEKSSRVNLRNAISKIYTRGFFSNFKNEAVFEKIGTACHAKLFNFLKMWPVTTQQIVTCDKHIKLFWHNIA